MKNRNHHLGLNHLVPLLLLLLLLLTPQPARAQEPNPFRVEPGQELLFDHVLDIGTLGVPSVIEAFSGLGQAGAKGFSAGMAMRSPIIPRRLAQLLDIWGYLLDRVIPKVKRGWVAGIDVSPVMVENCRVRYRTELKRKVPILLLCPG